jgi:hypothetical protein
MYSHFSALLLHKERETKNEGKGTRNKEQGTAEQGTAEEEQQNNSKIYEVQQSGKVYLLR